MTAAGAGATVTVARRRGAKMFSVYRDQLGNTKAAGRRSTGVTRLGYPMTRDHGYDQNLIYSIVIFVIRVARRRASESALSPVAWQSRCRVRLGPVDRRG